MASVHDVAAHVLDHQAGEISTWKLQKLVYYAQAWHLAWEDAPLFDARIEAWANGPVVRDLYDRHRKVFAVADWPWGNVANLTQSERDTIDVVLSGYGKFSGRQLSHLTHNEAPWRDAREGLGSTDRSSVEITPAAMQAYYSALDADAAAQPVEAIDWNKIIGS